jgi:hypothetical protein
MLPAARLLGKFNREAKEGGIFLLLEQVKL